MKSSPSIAAALLAATTVLCAGTAPAAAEPCAGPFRECAISVGAKCSRDADGAQRMTYWEGSGRVIQFEQCVGKVFEARGRPNPYKTGIAVSGGLAVPRTQLLYPLIDP